MKLKLCQIMLLLFACLTSRAYDFGHDILMYNIIDDETTTNVTEVEVTYVVNGESNANYYLGNIVIPSGFVKEGIPYKVVRIGEHAFSNCKELTSIVIPNSVESICNFAFINCVKLTSINIPNRVEYIGTQAFNFCDNVASWYIPSSVTYIDSWSAFGTSRTTSIIVDENNPVYDSRNNCNAIIETATNKLLQGCATTVIPTDVTIIGQTALSGKQNLNSIDIPANITQIEKVAFAHCLNLSSVTCHWNEPISFDEEAFISISETCTLTVPYGTKDAYIAAGWTEEIFKGGIVETDNIAFTDAKVKALCIANWDTNEDGELSGEEAAAVTDIGQVFKENRDITSFNELKYFTGLTTINNAFTDCSKLTSIIIPNNVKNITNYALSSTGLIDVTIPSSVRDMEWGTFMQSQNLKKVVIEEGTTNIMGNTFAWCYNLEEVEFPSTISKGSMLNVLGKTPKLTHVVMPINAPLSRHAEIFNGDDWNHSVLFTIPEGSAKNYLEKGYYNISDKSALAWMKTEFEAEATRVAALKTASGITASDEAKTALQNAIDKAQATVADAESYLAIGTQIDAIKAAAKTFLSKATIEAGTDVTAIVRNPQFDRMDFGWNVKVGAPWQGCSLGYQNDEEYNEHTNGEMNIHNFLEAWWNDVTLENGEITQTIADLPAGIYRLEVDAIATRQTDETAKVTGVSFFASNSAKMIATADKKPEHFSIRFENNNIKDVTIGVKWSNTTANWVAFDNIRLIYEGETATTPAGTELASSEEDTYYIYNVETGMYLNGGNGYGTQAVLAETGLPVRMTQDGEGYWEIYFREGSRHEQKLYRNDSFNQLLIDYVDDWGDNRWIITSQNGGYTIQLASDQGTDIVLGNDPSRQDFDVKQFIALDTHIEVIRTDNAAHNTLWQFIKGADYDLLMAKRQLLAAIFRMEQTDDVNDALLNEGYTIYNNNAATLAEIIDITMQLNSQIGMPEAGKSVNMTALITNPHFEEESGAGWTGSKLVEDGNAKNSQFETHEFYHTKFNMYQKITGVPNGLYRLKYKGFYRPGEWESACENYDPNASAVAVVYANEVESPFKHIYADASNKHIVGYAENEYNGKYIPDTQESSRKYFDAGLYDNYLEVEVTDNTLTIGVKNVQEMGEEYWVCFSDFELEIVENKAQMENKISMADSRGIKGGKATLKFSLNNETDIAGVQFDVKLPEGVSFSLDGSSRPKFSATSRTKELTVMTSMVNGNARVLIYGIGQKVEGSSGTIISMEVQISDALDLDDYQVEMTNIILSEPSGLKIKPFEMKGKLTLVDAEIGDANRDGAVDVTDIISVANYILGSTSASFDAIAADINGDSEIDVTDIIGIANVILGGSAVEANQRMLQEMDPQ